LFAVIDDLRHLLSLVRYIHLNPVRAKLVQTADAYLYSGHREYCGTRVSEVLEPDRVLDMLGGRAAYRRFVQDGLKDGYREEYYDVIDQRFLGEERFVEKLKVHADKEPAIPRPKQPLRVAFRSAARALEIDPALLSGADCGWNTSRSRALVAYVLIRRLGYKLTDVAKCLSRDTATVSSLVSRYWERMAEDKELKKQVAVVAKILSRIERRTRVCSDRG